jgi:exopolyphosphatase/guanosine-5'-triphosphate,3'-diphosphate pyrophosphatase
VAAAVEQATGIPLDIVDKEREGELTFLGVTGGQPGGRPLLVVDIGGGSSEVVLFDPQTGLRPVGLQTGSNRLTSEFIEHDPPTADEVGRLRARAAELAATLPDASPARAIFVGGTATNIIRLCPLATAEFDGLYQTLTTVSAADLVMRYALRPRRAVQLAAGAALAEAILTRYQLTEADVSDASLRDGAIIAAAGGSSPS